MTRRIFYFAIDKRKIKVAAFERFIDKTWRKIDSIDVRDTNGRPK